MNTLQFLSDLFPAVTPCFMNMWLVFSIVLDQRQSQLHSMYLHYKTQGDANGVQINHADVTRGIIRNWNCTTRQVQKIESAFWNTRNKTKHPEAAHLPGNMHATDCYD